MNGPVLHTQTEDRPQGNNGQRRLRSLQIGMGWFPESGANGLDRMYYGLARSLPEAGVDVRGWVTGDGSVSDDSEGRIRAFECADASLGGRLWAIRNAMRRNGALDEVDVVASHFALYTAPLVDLIRHRPLIVHFHGPWAAESAVEGASRLRVYAKRRIEQLVYRRADAFVVLSNAFGEVLAGEYGVDPELIRVVPGGVDVSRFAPATSTRRARLLLDLPVDRPIVVSVRRLVHRVGLELLVDAVDHLRTREPDVLLLIAGRGPLADRLEQRIRDLDLSRHVRLLGFVPENHLPLLYRAADVSVVPSTSWEGFGLVAAESLAARTPALVTPVGGLPEVVRPLSEALIVEDATPEALTDGLCGVLDGRRRVPSGPECEHYARTHFDWPVIARKTRDVYTEVAE